MLDHITLRVRDFAASKAYYAAALAPLGYALVMEFPDGAGFGVAGKPDFWIMVDPEAKPQHVAFHAKDHAAVDRYHAAAIGAGGRDNGAPGLRLDYHPNYYGAFVYDPSGHNIEAVCHAPPAAARKKTPPRKAARTAGKRKGAAKPAARKGARKSRR